MNKLIMIIIMAASMCAVVVSAEVACTMEAKICPDGSSVGRVGPNCEFAPCPECIRRPLCLDSNPPCMIPEPANSWCTNTRNITHKGYFNNEIGAPERKDIDESFNHTIIDQKIFNHTIMRERIESKIIGLKELWLMANDTTLMAKIQADIEEWELQHGFNYSQVNGTTGINGNTIIRARREAWFLFFRFYITDEYEVNNQGMIMGEHRGWISQLFPPKTITS